MTRDPDEDDVIPDDGLWTRDNDEVVEDFEFSLDRLGKAYSQLMRESSEASSAADESSAEDSFESESLTESFELDESSEERDNAPCPVSESSVLEAILFVGTPPQLKLTAKKLASMVRDVSPAEIKKIVQRLNEAYQKENSAIRIVAEGSGYRMDLADDSLRWKERFQSEVRDAQLNQQVIDVLAIVAYHQPIKRKEIEAIRQRPSGGAIQQLIGRRLIAADDERSQPRNPAFRTTSRFLELFGLDAIEDLPQAQEVDNIDEFMD